jgi:membrane protein YqaA with SNARE-associated domain
MASHFFIVLKKKLQDLLQSPFALYFVGFICFLEPIALPMVPELVIGPTLYARKEQRFSIILIAVLGTVLGAIFTYSLGYFLGHVLVSWLEYFSADKLYTMGVSYLETYGVFLPFVMSLTPLPLKIVTWSCGIARFSFPIYLTGIAIGRLLRYSFMLLLSPKKTAMNTSPSLAHSSSAKSI